MLFMRRLSLLLLPFQLSLCHNSTVQGARAYETILMPFQSIDSNDNSSAAHIVHHYRPTVNKWFCTSMVGKSFRHPISC